MPRILKRLTIDRTSARRLWRSEDGSTSTIFALSLVPLVGLAGLGIDYGMAISAKAKLANAADAASVAAVATAVAYAVANPTDLTLTADAINAGKAQAGHAFAVNAGSVPFTTLDTPNIQLNRNGQTFSSTVNYTASLRNNFGQILGQRTTNLAGQAAAVADIPKYIDFYLLIDVSASMGLPSTFAGEQAVANNSGYSNGASNNCQFACHFPDQIAGYNYAVNNGVQLRSGAVNQAVCALLNMAAQTTVKGQYRVGLYPFITQMATLSPITASISSSSNAATCNSSPPTEFTTLLDNGSSQLTVNSNTSTGTGSGGTHFETSLATMQTTVSSYGDGSSALLSKPFVFIITDGMENMQYFDVNSNGTRYFPGGSSTSQQNGKSWWDGGSSPQAMNPANCALLKNLGATISILYIPYTLDNFVNGDSWEVSMSNNAVTPPNSNTPSLQTQLQKCASPGSQFFHVANTPADITNALKAMFNTAVQVAHLTK